ncbi:MAG: hypothetical protein EA341_00525 [Mongoliibacter sp.]|uniref:hypothetical protein n=1 Tax=Mongoliibacter sp. TaxID=2022438 RepID=UPI0012F3B221|nr:hypothetical protein [Mongoliibacter sp.]TVP53919.1 MAG: hypothetical protein EA341_00525 [Mongoliibacter sp.]
MNSAKNSMDRLRLLFEEQITVMTIAENLKIFDLSSYQEEMAKLNFNTAVIFDQGKWLKYDKGDAQPSPVSQVDLMPENTPILTAFRLLLGKRKYFIPDESGKLSYIVTRTDLDKIPLRIGIFGLISVLETHLKDLVRHHIPNWQESLSENRLQQAISLYEWKKERKEEIDLVQCLQFGDLGSIFSKNQRFKKFDPDFSRDNWVDMMNAIGKLRDALAHSQLRLGFSWEEIDRILLFIRGIIDKENKIFEI